MILPNVPIAVHADEAGACEHVGVSEDGTVSGNGVCEICAMNQQEEEQVGEEQKSESGSVSEKQDSQEKIQQVSGNDIIDQKNEGNVTLNSTQESKNEEKQKEKESKESKNGVSGNSISENGIESNKDLQNNSESKEVLVLTDSIEQVGLGSIYDVVPRRMGFFSLRPGNVWDNNSNTYYGQLDDDSKEVYDLLKVAYQNEAKYDDVSISFSKVISSSAGKPENDKVPSEVSNTISEEVKNIVSYALLALIYDEPEMSWIVNVSMSYSWAYDYTTTDNTNYTLKLPTLKMGSAS